MKLPNALHPKTEAETINQGRRTTLTFTAIAVPLLLLGLGTRASADACFDLNALPASQKRQRRSLGFKLAAADDPKHCGTCAFFKPSGGDCGTCEMLSGGTTATLYVCDSWAAKS